MMDQEQIAEHRAMLRREFPVERLPTIVSARGFGINGATGVYA